MGLTAMVALAPGALLGLNLGVEPWDAELHAGEVVGHLEVRNYRAPSGWFLLVRDERGEDWHVAVEGAGRAKLPPGAKGTLTIDRGLLGLRWTTLHDVRLPPPAGANAAEDGGLAPGDCEVPADLELPLLFELAKREAALGKLRAGLEEVRPGAVLECGGGRRGYVLLRLSELTRLLGAAATFSCVAGAGNATDKHSYRASLQPAGYVPPMLSGAVVRLSIEDDPKFLLAGAAGYRPCSPD